MKQESIEQKFDGYKMDEEILDRMKDIPFNRQAMCFFMSILQKRIEPYYSKVEFGPNVAAFVFRKLTLDPVYCELGAMVGKKKKVIVKAYNDRKIQICDNNPYLLKTCRELSDKTHGNIKIYLEHELKYIY
ncbi:MAG: hypothetical protein KKE23_01605 [Nanoarchaeota archaeon]|nr:hypothetical protein [Nanoarchaeota archaeon]